MIALGVLNAMAQRLQKYLRYGWNEVNFLFIRITFDRLYQQSIAIPQPGISYFILIFFIVVTIIQNVGITWKIPESVIDPLNG